jgi:hypothetical protein
MPMINSVDGEYKERLKRIMMALGELGYAQEYDLEKLRGWANGVVISNAYSECLPTLLKLLQKNKQGWTPVRDALKKWIDGTKSKNKQIPQIVEKFVERVGKQIKFVDEFYELREIKKAEACIEDMKIKVKQLLDEVNFNKPDLSIKWAQFILSKNSEVDIIREYETQRDAAGADPKKIPHMEYRKGKAFGLVEIGEEGIIFDEFNAHLLGFKKDQIESLLEAIRDFTGYLKEGLVKEVLESLVDFSRKIDDWNLRNYDKTHRRERALVRVEFSPDKRTLVLIDEFKIAPLELRIDLSHINKLLISEELDRKMETGKRLVPLQWIGTNRSWADTILKLFKEGKIKATSSMNALEQASFFFIDKKGKPFDSRTAWQNIKNREDFEGK